MLFRYLRFNIFCISVNNLVFYMDFSYWMIDIRVILQNYKYDTFLTSFCILLSNLLSFGDPSIVFIIVCRLIVHRCVQVRSHHQRGNFIHNLYQSLSWGPFVSCFEHVGTNLALIINVRVVNFGLEGNDWPFEREIIQFELNLELASFERSLCRTSDVDFPQSVVVYDYIVASEIKRKNYYFSSYCLYLLSLGADIVMVYKNNIKLG